MPSSRLIAVLGVAGALIAPAAAHATVTSSAVTTVTTAQGPHMTDDRDQAPTAPANAITVSGTTDGTTGDNVKLACQSRNNAQNVILTASTAVAANGSFTFTGSIRNIYTYLNSCDLRAVPAGTSPSNVSSYVAKRLQVGEKQTYKNGTGPNAGIPTDFWLETAGDKAGAGYNSIGGCGLCDMSLSDPATLLQSPEMYGSNAALFYGTEQGPNNRPQAKIDGAPAYVTSAAYMTSTAAGGITPMAYTMSVDPANGDLTVHETDVVVTCPVFPITNGAANCPTFSSTGVTIERTIKQNHQGQLVAITDTIRSTDGNAHTFDFDYFQWVGSQAGYQFPGQSSFATHSTNDVVSGTPAPAGVSQFILNNSAAASFTNPLGAMVTTPAANSYTFGQPSSFYDNQTGTVPAGGSTVVRHIYAMAANQADLDALKADAVDIYVAPSVTLNTPSDVTTSQVTLTGTASAMGTLTGVKVNGVDATVDGQGNWAVTIPVSSGANAISVVATNSAGLTQTATGSVTYTVPTTPTPDPTPTVTTATPVTTTTTAKPAETPLPIATIPVTTKPATRTLDVALQTKNNDMAPTAGTAKTTKVALACTGTGTCGGTVKMTKVLKVDGERRQLVLGTAKYAIQAGKTVLVPLKLTAFGRKMLGRRWERLVHAQVRVTQDGYTSGGTVAIKRTR